MRAGMLVACCAMPARAAAVARGVLTPTLLGIFAQTHLGEGRGRSLGAAARGTHGSLRLGSSRGKALLDGGGAGLGSVPAATALALGISES